MKKNLTIFIMIMFVMIGIVSANTIESSTMIFEGELTPSGDGYTGVVPMVVDGGYDVYAKEGASAWFGDGSPPDTVWDNVVISNHDAFLPNTLWYPDTPDWYQYSLEFDGNNWAVRNHPGASAVQPWSSAPETYPAKGVPMSGNMNWVTMFASEDDVGAYLPGTGIPEILGGAESKGGGAKAWDMDWSWGSEVVPLEHGGFLVDVENLGDGDYRVTMTPSTIYLPKEGDYVGNNVQIKWYGTFETASLAYLEGICKAGTTGILEGTISSSGTYNWDTLGLSDGTYCIKIVTDDKLYDSVEVVKDTTPPVIEFDENVWFTEANKTVYITGNITDEKDIAWYNIDFGDGIDFSIRIWEENTSLEFNKSHIYTEEGKYTIEIYARDEAGNVNSNSVNVIVSMEEPDWIIELNEGLNYISIPFMPEEAPVSHADGVFKKVKCNINAIWSYQYDSSGKNKWFVKTVSDTCGWGPQTVFDIVPGRGYVVDMRENDILYGKAKTSSLDSEGNPELPSNIVKLATRGYNLIGVFGNEDLSEDDLNEERISTGNKDTRVVQNIYEGNGNELVGNLISKKAYWLSMTNLDINLPYYEYKI